MSKKTDKLNRRNLLKASIAAATMPAIVGGARAQEKVTWKVQSHWPKASGSFNDSLGVLAKELDTRTGGSYKLELYGAGEIAKDREIYNVVTANYTVREIIEAIRARVGELRIEFVDSPIMNQLSYVREWGGRFVVPIPTVQVHP